MCADPAGAEEGIRALVPALDDLNLRRRHAVKEYDEELTDMNAQQVERLDADRVNAFNRVFAARRDDLGHFGYGLMGGWRRCKHTADAGAELSSRFMAATAFRRFAQPGWMIWKPLLLPVMVRKLSKQAGRWPAP